jgi:hypothetical protein
VSCVLQTECPSDRYCSGTDKVCRNDGTCFDDSECNQVGNDYPRPTCVGIGICTDGACTYLCAP